MAKTHPGEAGSIPAFAIRCRICVDARYSKVRLSLWRSK